MADRHDTPSSTDRLIEVILDEHSITHSSRDVEHERAIAIYDLLEDNVFRPIGLDEGPYRLTIAMVDQRMMLHVTNEGGKPVATHILSLSPFRRIIKDYFMICDSYFSAIKTATPSQIEAIDMGRRGVHNEGSEILRARLAGKIDIDVDTSRRLFTLVCALHWKG